MGVLWLSTVSHYHISFKVRFYFLSFAAWLACSSQGHPVYCEYSLLTRDMGASHFISQVNKWLAEQTALMTADPNEFLSLARRQKKAQGSGMNQSRGGDALSRAGNDPMSRTSDPMAGLLDWKKLSGDEPVSVVHKTTGQKV